MRLRKREMREHMCSPDFNVGQHRIRWVSASGLQLFVFLIQCNALRLAMQRNKNKNSCLSLFAKFDSVFQMPVARPQERVYSSSNWIASIIFFSRESRDTLISFNLGKNPILVSLSNVDCLLSQSLAEWVSSCISCSWSVVLKDFLDAESASKKKKEFLENWKPFYLSL